MIMMDIILHSGGIILIALGCSTGISYIRAPNPQQHNTQHIFNSILHALLDINPKL